MSTKTGEVHIALKGDVGAGDVRALAGERVGGQPVVERWFPAGEALELVIGGEEFEPELV